LQTSSLQQFVQNRQTTANTTIEINRYASYTFGFIVQKSI